MIADSGGIANAGRVVSRDALSPVLDPLGVIRSVARRFEPRRSSPGGGTPVRPSSVALAPGSPGGGDGARGGGVVINAPILLDAPSTLPIAVAPPAAPILRDEAPPAAVAARVPAASIAAGEPAPAAANTGMLLWVVLLIVAVVLGLLVWRASK